LRLEMYSWWMNKLFGLALFVPLCLPISNSLPLMPSPVCPQQVFQGPHGYIQSKNFPRNYEDELECYQIIRVQEGYVVQLVFYVFETEEDQDTVTIYEGEGASKKELVVLSGGGPAHTVYKTSKSNVMTVYFMSDMDNNYAGYYARFDQVKSATETKLQNDCISMPVFDDSYGVLVSPNWPKEYPNEQNCYYKIHLPSSVLAIHFRVNFFETELDHDYVNFFEGKNCKRPVDKLTGDVKPGTTLEIYEPDAILQFFSDIDVQFRGFSITYEAVTKHSASMRNISKFTSD